MVLRYGDTAAVGVEGGSKFEVADDACILSSVFSLNFFSRGFSP